MKIEQKKEIKLPTLVLAADSYPEGDRFLAACFDGGVYEVTLTSGEIRKLAKHESYASGVRYLPGLKQVVSAGYDGKIIWTDPTDQKTIRTVDAHKFWSWQMDISPDQKLVASCTGQYQAGGYKYEPAPEQEPSVKVFDSESGKLKWELGHVPPVLSLAFSPDSRFLAAGNMMGEIRVWDLATGKLTTSWTTPDFTSWGIIKSHHYIGGIFDLAFTLAGDELIACGMGPMRDPMAGNGEQKWQRFVWRESKKTAQIKEGDRGNGLMETMAFHPSKSLFVMAGRLAQGKWNAAFFDESGALLHSVDNKIRITDSLFINGGEQLLLSGGNSQGAKKDGKYPEFGRMILYSVTV